MNKAKKEKKAKKAKKESLLVKYGLISFIVIVISIVSFTTVTIEMSKKPVASIYEDSMDTILIQAVDSAETWFENQVELLKVFQSSVVNKTENRNNIKNQIKIKQKPEGFEYVMVFWDDATGAKDGGPETYNTRGGISTAGILSKEYWINHKSSDVSVWLESPRESNLGAYTIPLFVKSEFVDDVTGKKVNGGMVGFLELDPIHSLARTFFKTGQISIYDDTGAIRAGEDILNLDNTTHLAIYKKECHLANKTWTVVASIEKAELSEVTSSLRTNQIVGGFIAAIIIIICILIIITRIVGKFDSIKKNIDNLNTGDKDLTRRLEVFHNNEISDIKRSVNTFIGNIHETVKEIGDANGDLNSCFNNVKYNLDDTRNRVNNISNQINNAKEILALQDNSVSDTSSAVTQISANIKSLNNMIDSQATAITQSSTSIEEMIGSINSVSEAVSKMSNEFAELSAATTDGILKNTIVNELLQTILEQSKSLQETNTVIASISSQTNLLSMNAMIESAHAGESGKGFAVVAEEIRKLADTSGIQSKNIGENLKMIAENITKVVESATASTKSFETVAKKTDITSTVVAEITNAMNEQTAGSKQILDALSNMNNTSVEVQNASREMEKGTNEILNATLQLKESTQNLGVSFNEIVSTVNTTVENTESLSDITEKMSDAVNNISEKISEFKI